jgi:hypothetical protein
MGDGFFNVPTDKQARVMTIHQRKDNGTPVENLPQVLNPVRFSSGGAGLYSTALDYLKLARMVLGVQLRNPEGSERVGRSQSAT